MRLVLILLLLTTIAGLSVCTHISTTADKAGHFTTGTVTVNAVPHPFQVFVPGPAAGTARPAVIVSLHGSGERGTDNQAQTQVGLGAHVRAHLADFPAIVLFPQAPDNTEWNQLSDVVLAQLDQVLRQYNADPDRVYLTGLSMGGYGAWDLALRAPDRFAALVPICGGIIAPPGRPQMSVTGLGQADDPYAAVAARLQHMPIWIFHGARDDLVPVDYARRMNAALQSVPARDAHYTEFPEAGHNSWDPAYQHTPALWTWLLAQHRPAR